MRGWSPYKFSVEAELAESQVANLITRSREGREDASGKVLAALAKRGGANLLWLITGEGASGLEDGEQGGVPAPPVVGDDDRPRYEDLREWPEIERRARAMAPAVEEWAWAFVKSQRPILTAPLTPVMVAEFATWVWRHEQEFKPREPEAQEVVAPESSDESTDGSDRDIVGFAARR